MYLLSRRRFIALGGSAAWVLSSTIRSWAFHHNDPMKTNNGYDVVIVGGSYSGLAAGMALGRALRRVLIVDGGMPCNRQTPRSHNFITQDGSPPQAIAMLAKQQVERYGTVEFMSGLVTDVTRTERGFDVRAGSALFTAKKVVFATGVRDVMPDIPGFAACWGISVLHCPYCHGYEVRHETTGVLGNGERGFDLVRMISNWTKDLTLFTNGPSTLTGEQAAKLRAHDIRIVEGGIVGLAHTRGQLEHVRFANGSTTSLKALYAQPAFEQHSPIPQALGCELTEDGYLKVDPQQRTSIPGIYACGDNTTRLRTVAGSVAQGTTAGMMLNKDLIAEEF